MDEDEDDRDTFAFVGTPLDPYEQDEALKKPVPIQDQIATDDRGRRRFHGAFTGGFSAGYFNTVGTEEGWTPSGYKSSREQRNDVAQKPEDFMDEEDFGEHGIAPRQISTTEKFTSADESRKRKVPSVLDTNIIPGESPLQGLVKAAKVSMGTKLLRKLGWKEGQGIGPRVKKKKVKRFYGCALPPELQAAQEVPSGSSSSEEEEDLHPDDVTFAPKDVNPIDFKPKDNVQGIGYSGLNAQTELGHVNLFEPPPIRQKGRKGFTGQAFGVGAFEDEDDDIYALDHMSNYSRELVLEEEGVTEKGKHTRKRQSRWDATAVIEKALDGFHISAKPEPMKEMYPPPDIPKEFIPKHVFKTVTTAPALISDSHMDASKRSALLGETPEIKSVFDLVTDKDKERMENIKNPKAPENAPSSPPLDKPPSNSMLNTSTFQDFLRPGASASGFEPFAKDPSKQSRYEKYLAAKKQGSEISHVHEETELTEWEKGREREEFERASALYRPLSSLMASRFTTAKMKHDDDRTVELNAETGGDECQQERAVAMKMFGKLTRDRWEWHPDKILCKRFNVANPYPDSTIVGLPKVKRDKFSVFNFLGFPGTAEEKAAETPRPKTTEKEDAYETPKSNLKPLAILGSMDLRPKTQPRLDLNKAEEIEDKESEESEEEEEDVVDDRPSMDLFKAIFENSEDEEEAEEREEEAMDTTEPEKEEVPPPNVEVEEVKPVEEQEDRLRTPEGRPQTLEESVERNAGTLTDLINSVLSSTDSDSESSDSEDLELKEKKKKKAKKKKSKKSKKKKAKAKKSKHKKHKSKKKKKKKTKENDTDSEKESDSEDESLNQVLAQKLSSLSRKDRSKLLKR